MNTAATDPQPRPGLLRRLIAIVYDTLLLFSVLFVAAIPLALLPAALKAEPYTRLGEQAYLVGVVFLFFGWFWVHGGQTLGMRAWRLKLVDRDGGPVGWGRALLRFTAAALSWAAAGLGFWWILVDREKLAWHDRLSGTRMVMLPKRARESEPASPAETPPPA